jgi:hypothetical protein
MKDKLEKLIQLSATLLFLIITVIFLGMLSVVSFQLINEPNTVSVLFGIMLLLLCLVGCTTLILITIHYFKNKLWD